VDRTFKLCSNATCCPEVTFRDNGAVEIKDDLGGRVVLNPKELRMLIDESEVWLAEETTVP